MKELSRRYSYDYETYYKKWDVWKYNPAIKSFDTVEEVKQAIVEEKKLRTEYTQVRNFRIIEFVRAIIEENV